MSQQTRREFLDRIAAAGFAGFALSAERAWGLQAVPNPLAVYPNRDWERTYRDLWAYDSKFTFTCAPNDTHNCILNAYVKNGVIARIGPSMRYGEA
jgi:nitrate reductase alpha subunit